MAEAFIRQAILHAIAAAGIVEALLAAWRIRSASARLKFWFVALAVPFLLLPLIFIAAPFRLDDHFAANRALFASIRWHPIRVAGVAVDDLAFGLLAAAGLALLLRDVVPLVGRLWRERAAEQLLPQPAAGSGPAVEGLEDLIRQHADRLGVRHPRLQVLPHEAPVLFVRGLRAHTLVVSTGALARLSAEQRAAAVAHELVHVRLRDPLLGWLLMVARLLMFWNPAVQLVARAIVEETEHRADAAAVRATSPEAYVAAFRLLAAGEPARPDGSSAWRRIVDRAHLHHVSRRAAAAVAFPAAPSFLATRLVATSALLAGLALFVV